MKTTTRIGTVNNMTATEQDRTHSHYRGLLGRLEDQDPLARANRTRAAMGHPPLSRRAVEHDRSLAAYDRALGEGRN